jgi:hypothetical protein
MEAWLSGPVPGVPPLLQPVAHMLLHTKDDARVALEGLTPEQVWARPGSGASVGYHVRHLIGALDRLLTYALGGALDQQQMAYLKKGATPATRPLTRRRSSPRSTRPSPERWSCFAKPTRRHCSNRVPSDASSCRRRCWDCWRTRANTPPATPGRRSR